jgi:hypothetical protein
METSNATEGPFIVLPFTACFFAPYLRPQRSKQASRARGHAQMLIDRTWQARAIDDRDRNMLPVTGMDFKNHQPRADPLVSIAACLLSLKPYWAAKQ